MKKCNRCSGTYSLEFFSKNGKRNGKQLYRSVCRGCIQAEGDRIKRLDRSIPKAKWAISYHLRKYKSLKLVSTRQEFLEKFQWNYVQMSRDIKRVFNNGCSACGNGVEGWRDVVITRIDTARPPGYDNMIWVCSSCAGRHANLPFIECDMKTISHPITI